MNTSEFIELSVNLETNDSDYYEDLIDIVTDIQNAGYKIIKKEES